MAKRKSKTKSYSEKQTEAQLPIDESQVLLGWLIPEYEKHSRGPKWYWAAGILVFVIVVYAIVVGNYLFALLAVLIGAIVIFHEIKQPREVYFAITENEITIDMSVISHKQISEFWVVVTKEQVLLYFDFKNILRPRVMVPVPSEIAQDAVDLLSTFIEHNQEQDKMPRTDAWARRLKL